MLCRHVCVRARVCVCSVCVCSVCVCVECVYTSQHRSVCTLHNTHTPFPAKILCDVCIVSLRTCVHAYTRWKLVRCGRHPHTHYWLDFTMFSKSLRIFPPLYKWFHGLCERLVSNDCVDNYLNGYNALCVMCHFVPS
jgi:hypothetical protein